MSWTDYPRPWRFGFDNPSEYGVYDARGNEVWHANSYESPCFGESDARLIAAAPLLLEALRMIVEADDNNNLKGKDIDRARAAIAAATGEAA